MTAGREVHFQSRGVVTEDTVLTLEPENGGRATRVTARYKCAGASFSDGGASRRARWEASLGSLKKLVESQEDSRQAESLSQSGDSQQTARSAPQEAAPQSPPADELHCVTCSTVFQDWRYGFESIVYGDQLGWQCSNCGQAFCMEHAPSTFRNPGDTCSCGGWVTTLEEGPADASLLDGARRDGKYGRHLHPPGLQRPVA